MFEKAADDGAHADVFRQPLDPPAAGLQTPHQEIDGDPGLGGLVEGGDDRRFEEEFILATMRAFLPPGPPRLRPRCRRRRWRGG